MHTLTRPLRWIGARQQPLVAGFVALSLLAASLGIPVFVEPVKDTSRPYPCMHHRCGCTSAEACWRGCCCMTLSQKLAWAKEHGVTPPDYVLAQVEHQTEKKSCGSCCRHDAKPPANGKDLHEHDGVAESKPEEPTTGMGLVLVDDFRHCQGLSSLWLTIGHALPPKVETSAAPFRPAPSWWLRVTSQSAESLALSPATPPPRHS